MVRRRAILASGGVALAAGALALAPGPAHTPLAEQPPDLRDLWTEIITARARIDMRDERIRSQVRGQDREVAAHLRARRRGQAGEFFLGYDLRGTDSHAFSGTATRLATMARCWATPASRWFASHRVEDTLVEGLEQMHAAGYRRGGRAIGSWWDWEIGAARPLADVACLMRDVVPPDLLTAVLTAIRYFIPDPRWSRASDYPSTGANRVNTSRAALIAALVEQDADRVLQCVEAVAESWQLVDTGDGFHEDGGFIQHLDNPYTGSYGVELIRDAAPLLALIEGTEFDVVSREPLWDLVEEAYFPVMITGHISDSLRGRAVSRVATNGSAAGRIVMASVAQLAEDAPLRRRAAWLARMARWTEASSGTDLLQGHDIPGTVQLQVLTGISGRAAEEAGSVYYPSMDRLVHRGRGWTAVLSMASSRIAAYEFSIDENIWASRTGNAMRYLFVGDDPAPYDDGYWATLNYALPPGTTNHRTALAPKVERPDGGTRPQNEWTAGFVRNGLSIAAMHQVPLDGDVPECRKLIVGTPSMLVEMVAGIVTAHGPAVTAVENRPFAESGTFVVDGREVVDSAASARPSWAHLSGIGGYLFLSPAALDASVGTRVGSDRRVERAVAEIDAQERISRRWASILLTHADTGRAEPADAWALLPGATLEDTRRAAAEAGSTGLSPDVVRNDATAQVLRLGATIAIAAVWGPALIACGGTLRIRCPHPLLLLAERGGHELRMMLVEPTRHRTDMQIEVSGLWALGSADGVPPSGVTVRHEGGYSLLAVAAEGLDGRPASLTLSAI